MNDRIKELAKQAGFYFYDMHNIDGQDLGESIEADSWSATQKFAELIVLECTDLLWNESERLYAYSSECNEVRDSDEALVVAEKCLDNIKMLIEHFGVEE